MDGKNNSRYCVIVPAYQESGRIGRVVEAIREYCPDVIVVDDGSSDSTAAEAERAGATVLRNRVNMGKGIALDVGMAHAREGGYDFVITMDADGQHAPSDIPVFVEEYSRSGIPVLIGNRMSDPGTMPAVRRLTNRFMSWLLSRKMGQRVPDTQCGYRLYSTDCLPPPMPESGRFAAESEVLLHIAAQGVKIGSVPIKVIYGDEKSKINPVKDTVRFFAMLRRFERHGPAVPDRYLAE